MFEMDHHWTKSIAQPRVTERAVECSNIHLGHNVSRSRLLRCHSPNQLRKTCARKAEKTLSRCVVVRFRRQECTLANGGKSFTISIRQRSMVNAG